MIGRLLPALTWLAFPIYAVQGIAVRVRALRLPPATGDVLSHIDGAEPGLALLAIGDSAVAGVGLDRLEDAVAHRTAAMLAPASGRAVSVRAAGFNSITAGGLRDSVVPNLDGTDWHVVVISVGVNDVKNFHSVRRWKREFGGLIYALRARYPRAVILWSQIPRFIDMPALPKLLARLLDIRADAFNAMASRLCRERGAHILERANRFAPETFAVDGFHPGEPIHRLWAEALAARIAELVSDESPG